MPSTNFATVRGRSPGARSNPHISRILIAGILLFGGGGGVMVARKDRRRGDGHQ